MSMHHVERAAVLQMMAARKLIFMAICDAADKDTGLGFPGFDSMQEWSGVGKSQVHEHLAALIADGYIERVEAGRRGRRAVFRVFARVACCELHEPIRSGSGAPDPTFSTPESGQPDSNGHLGSGIGSGLGPVKGPVQTGPLPSTQAPKQNLSVIADDDDDDQANGTTPTSPRDIHGPGLHRNHRCSTATDSPTHALTDGVTPPSPHSDGGASGSSRPTNATLDARFDEFWDAYGHKIARGSAVKAWRAALRRRVDPDLIIGAATAFRAKNTHDDKPAEFIPHAATWLNGERYADQAPAHVTQRPAVQLVEQAPDGLSDDEYISWQRDQLLRSRKQA